MVEPSPVRDHVAGAHAALDAVVAEVYPWARAAAYLLCRDAHEAADLVQDALVAALRRPPQPLTPDAMRAWLRTVMFRLYLRGRRRAVREARAVLRLGHPVPETIELSDDTREVIAALERLSPRQRACITLRYLEDLSEQQVALALGVRLGTVKAHLAQARERLRGTLAREIEALP